MVEPLSLFGGLERDGEFGGARRPEIIGDAADGDDERVVRDAARGADLPALLVEGGADLDGLARAAKPNHLAVMVAEAMPVGLGEIVELMLGRVHAPGRH